MIAIPLPFVVTLLLSILMVLLFVRRNQNTRPVLIFVALCTLATLVVGLRWTFELKVFRLLQPILAAFIPVTAWYCFANGYRDYTFSYKHLIVPLLVTLASFTYSLWQPPIDPILVLIYVAYGVALIRQSYGVANVPELIRLSDMTNALMAQRFTGVILIFSAVIETLIVIDFVFYGGKQVPLIISITHILLLPLYTLLIVYFSLSVPPNEDNPPATNPNPALTDQTQATKKSSAAKLTLAEAENIVQHVDAMLQSKEAFLDPDLTLDKLARKAGIPAKKLSAAVNQIRGRNVSQIVNEYRIERAKLLLSTTDESITRIYFDAGFQTKSNFNREFSRVTQQTPSAYRRSAKQQTS